MTATALPAPTGPHAVGRCASTSPITAAATRSPAGGERLAGSPSSPGTRPMTGGGPPGRTSRAHGAPRAGCGASVRPTLRTHAVDDAPPRRPGPGSRWSCSHRPPTRRCATPDCSPARQPRLRRRRHRHPYESMPLTVYRSGSPQLTRPAASVGRSPTRTRPFERGSRRPGRHRRPSRPTTSPSSPPPSPCRRAARPPPRRPSRWAAIGHSFGGGAAAEACRRGAVPRAPASTVASGGHPPSRGGGEPFLQLFAEHPELTSPIDESSRQAVRRPDLRGLRSGHDRRCVAGPPRHAGRHAALVTGGPHTSFCDWPLLPLRSWSPTRRALAGAAGPQAWSTSSNAIVAFLDQHIGAGHADVDVALAANSVLRFASPAALFAAERAAVA